MPSVREQPFILVRWTPSGRGDVRHARQGPLRVTDWQHCSALLDGTADERSSAAHTSRGGHAIVETMKSRPVSVSVASA